MKDLLKSKKAWVVAVVAAVLMVAGAIYFQSSYEDSYDPSGTTYEQHTDGHVGHDHDESYGVVK